ncbi:ATP-binding domain-containing protein, partial [Eubacteriales bacterium OttesenSCG-928-A19]|nr:ATP-binding domain-containing protein [Eubacteriales bacterium OttesenSCG-928-A19]
RLFADREAFERLCAGLLPAGEMETIRLATLRRLDGGELPYEDAAAIAYLEARVHGCRAYSNLRQVVVDEAQDLDPLHVTLLDVLFPNARFTVLGDVHQTLVGSADLSLYDDMRAALHKPSSLLVTLDKSFRCTREIWAFSAQFLPPGAAGECFSRSGESPGVHSAPDRAALDALLLEHAKQCRESGCESVALLCKTQRDATALYERLEGRESLTLAGMGGRTGSSGITIASLYMAKGLEFDAVLLCDVDAAHYHDEGDRNLLYIGCTRALHILRLYYTGRISPLITEKEGIGE